MASSISLVSEGYQGRYLELICTQTQNIAENTSTIHWALHSVGGEDNYYSVGPTTVRINGTTVYSQARVNWDAKTFPAAKGVVTGTTTVAHTPTGSMTISVSLQTAVYTGTTSTVSQSWTLDKIPRESSFESISGTIIGGQTTVSIKRASTAFTHQLWYKVGNSSWYDLGTGIGTSKSFTIDIANANQFPNAMSGTMGLCLRTFNGTTQVGSDVYHTVTVTVPEYTPTISQISLTGNQLRDDVYVQSKSTVTVNITASTMYGATIKTYSSTVDGHPFGGKSFTSLALSAGDKTVAVVVTDSRGKTATLTSDAFTVYPYALPSITSFTVERQADGTTVIAHLSGSVSPLNNKNTAHASIKLNGVTKHITMSAYTVNDSATFTGVPTDDVFVATAEIGDRYTYTSKDATLPTVAVTMDFHYSGTGIAMGQVATLEKTLDIASDWQLKCKGGVLDDFVIEQSTDGIWTYRKWNSGIAECWGTKTIENVQVNQAWGSLYYMEPSQRSYYPNGLFRDAPTETATMSCDDMWTWMGTATGNHQLATAQYFLMRPDAATTKQYTVRIHYHAKGRWK